MLVPLRANSVHAGANPAATDYRHSTSNYTALPQTLAPLLAGLLGTLIMALLQLLPAKLGWTRVDIIRAAGTYLTRDRETAFVPGMIMHFVVGIIFVYVYYFGFAFVGGGLSLNALTGLFAGAVHGVLVMLVVTIAVLEHHLMEQYHDRSPMTAFSQILAHAVYGVGRRFGVLRSCARAFAAASVRVPTEAQAGR